MKFPSLQVMLAIILIEVKLEARNTQTPRTTKIQRKVGTKKKDYHTSMANNLHSQTTTSSKIPVIAQAQLRFGNTDGAILTL